MDWAAANEQNWREGWRRLFGRWSRGEVGAGPQGLWYRSPVAHPLMNGVLRCHFRPEEAEEQVERMIDRFRERGVPFWWWTFPGQEPSDLGRLLERHGLVREADLPGMAVSLADLPEPGRLPEGVTVERVGDPAGLARWAEAYGRGFPAPEPVAEAHREAFAELGFAAGWSHYVALDQGRPVATSALFVQDGVAGLYFVCTLPEARGRGIGRAMVLTPLLAARAAGCRLGILQATAAGRPLYERLGFRECARWPQYLWKGGTDSR
ncbi:MAG: GNAT family N-acetyltransferase [Bacillota bacterium]